MTWTVADVMTKDVITVTPETSFKKCIDLMHSHEVGALPVVMGAGVVGIVSEADLMRKAAALPEIPGDVVLEPTRKGLALTAGELMTKEVEVIAPSASVGAAARLMFQRRIKHLPVISGSRRLVGIVSRADILRMFLRSDESIRKEVTALLNEMPLLGRGRVQVAVTDGIVRLDGVVESGSLTSLLIRLVRAVPGVVGVENESTLVYELEESKGSPRNLGGRLPDPSGGSGRRSSDFVGIKIHG
jgi:CBS domain-containing protein